MARISLFARLTGNWEQGCPRFSLTLYSVLITFLTRVVEYLTKTTEGKVGLVYAGSQVRGCPVMTWKARYLEGEAAGLVVSTVRKESHRCH